MTTCEKFPQAGPTEVEAEELELLGEVVWDLDVLFLGHVAIMSCVNYIVYTIVTGSVRCFLTLCCFFLFLWYLFLEKSMRLVSHIRFHRSSTLFPREFHQVWHPDAHFEQLSKVYPNWTIHDIYMYLTIVIIVTVWFGYWMLLVYIGFGFLA